MIFVRFIKISAFVFLVVEHPEYGEVIQLTGDQRQNIRDFLIKVGIGKEENVKVHGF